MDFDHGEEGLAPDDEGAVGADELLAPDFGISSSFSFAAAELAGGSGSKSVSSSS